MGRTEINIAVDVLLDSFRTIELIADRSPRFLADFVVHGLAELPVHVQRSPLGEQTMVIATHIARSQCRAAALP